MKKTMQLPKIIKGIIFIFLSNNNESFLEIELYIRESEKGKEEEEEKEGEKESEKEEEGEKKSEKEEESEKEQEEEREKEGEKEEEMEDKGDISTLSNYKDIPINYIYGDFKLDFKKKIVYGNLKYRLQANKEGNQIIFDTNKLKINGVYQITDPKEETESPLKFKLGEEDENLGIPLIIDIEYKIDDNI